MHFLSQGCVSDLFKILTAFETKNAWQKKLETKIRSVFLLSFFCFKRSFCKFSNLFFEKVSFPPENLRKTFGKPWFANLTKNVNKKSFAFFVYIFCFKRSFCRVSPLIFLIVVWIFLFELVKQKLKTKTKEALFDCCFTK